MSCIGRQLSVTACEYLAAAARAVGIFGDLRRDCHVMLTNLWKSCQQEGEIFCRLRRPPNNEPKSRSGPVRHAAPRGWIVPPRCEAPTRPRHGPVHSTIVPLHTGIHPEPLAAFSTG